MSTSENQNLSTEGSGTEKFRSDANKLAQEHLADENHKITDEDLRNIKVGQTPGPDAPTQQAIKDADDKIADRKSIDDNDDLPGDQKVTPWDTINQ